MPRTLRQVIGTMLLVIFVTIYSLLAMSVAAARLPGTSILVQTIYYAVAGLIWVLPAGLIIRWIKRP